LPNLGLLTFEIVVRPTQVSVEKAGREPGTPSNGQAG
jgi:hypothetical protein